jgi:hypothetical protein
MRATMTAMVTESHRTFLIVVRRRQMNASRWVRVGTAVRGVAHRGDSPLVIYVRVFVGFHIDHLHHQTIPP